MSVRVKEVEISFSKSQLSGVRKLPRTQIPFVRSLCIYPLTPKSDKYLISLNNITSESNI